MDVGVGDFIHKDDQKQDPTKAVPGGRYACSCGETFMAPMDALACCSQTLGKPSDGPVLPVADKDEEAYQKVMEDEQNQESR